METFLTKICASAIDMIVCIIYYNLLFVKKKDSVSYPFWLFCFILMELTLYINIFSDKFLSGLGLTLFSTFISMLTMYLLSLLYNSTGKHRIFTVITFQIIAIISEVISFTFGVSLYTVVSGHKPEDDQFAFLISKFIMMLFVSIVGLIYRKNKPRNVYSYSLRLLINPLLSIIILFCIWYSKEEYLEKNLKTNIPVFVAALALAFINFMSYFFLVRDAYVHELIEKKNRLENNELLQQEKYNQMSSNYKEVRSMLHDALKHDRYILSCARNKDFNSIEEYLEKDIERYTSELQIVNSQNLAIDVLLNNYIKKCKDAGIVFNPELSIRQKKIDISDYDINIILGNILDNAFNEVISLLPSFNRSIELKISTEDNKFVIYEKNSCSNNEKRMINPDEYYLKSNDIHHGYGIHNINKTCEKLKGISVFETEGNSFTVHIVIPLDQGDSI